MADHEFTQILYDVSDRVATITLHRPDKLNAFTGTMIREMIAAFDLVDADDDVRAVIVTGSGRAYCAGADLSSGGDTFARGGSDVATPVGVPRDGGGLTTLRIFECTKPVIGAINGAAVGVGVTMTLPMDIRLASTTARFGFVFARRGIVPEAASSYFLPRIVGISRAAEWCYTGRIFSAEEALDGRLVRSVHEPDDLVPAARALAAEIAEQRGAGLGRADPPDAVADAGRRPSDGGPPCRQPGDPVAGGERGRQRRGHELPREAARRVHRPGE